MSGSCAVDPHPTPTSESRPIIDEPPSPISQLKRELFDDEQNLVNEQKVEDEPTQESQSR
jgi:hypothetical protein